MNIILCGLPKCGKTTLGKILAKKINRNFIDTDTLIEKAYGEGAVCRDIYKKHGEVYFRAIEKQEISHLTPTEPSVIAIGGGSLLDVDNRSTLQKLGKIIYLKNDLEVIWKRMKISGMPAYFEEEEVKQKEAFYNLANTRLPIYASNADYSINISGMTVQSALEHLIAHI